MQHFFWKIKVKKGNIIHYEQLFIESSVNLGHIQLKGEKNRTFYKHYINYFEVEEKDLFMKINFCSCY